MVEAAPESDWLSQIEANATRFRGNPDWSRLRGGVQAWNAWRQESLVRPRLSSGRLSGLNLSGVDFRDTDLDSTRLDGANLQGASFWAADVNNASLEGADLRGAYLNGANLAHANLRDANLTDAQLYATRFHQTDLRGAVLTRAECGSTVFGDVDLSDVIGLEFTRHNRPSVIGVDSLIRCGHRLPLEFLTGVGLPNIVIETFPSLFAATDPIQFYSCFVSYSHNDERFTQHLYARMKRERLRVWFAPENVKGGQRLHEQLFEAIRLHDKLLLVLSQHSMASSWVKTEIKRARAREHQEKRQVLFPIRLVSMAEIRSWECFDADSGQDMAAEIREYYIPDFSEWMDSTKFESAFGQLLRDLRAGS